MASSTLNSIETDPWQSLAFVRQHDVTERAGNRVNNAFMGKSSPPVQSYVTVKDTKYKAMVEEATSQVGKDTLQHAPVLAACIFSHLGELSSVAIRTIEVITLAYRQGHGGYVLF